MYRNVTLVASVDDDLIEVTPSPIEDELTEDISVYFSDDNMPEKLIELAIKRAKRSFAKKRNYPSSYSDSKKLADMWNCYDCVYDLAIYFLVKQGAEFQSSHSENSVSRNWNTEADIFADHGVFPFANAL